MTPPQASHSNTAELPPSYSLSFIPGFVATLNSSLVQPLQICVWVKKGVHQCLPSMFFYPNHSDTNTRGVNSDLHIPPPLLKGMPPRPSLSLLQSFIASKVGSLPWPLQVCVGVEKGTCQLLNMAVGLKPVCEHPFTQPGPTSYISSLIRTVWRECGGCSKNSKN